jgi:tetratricopeptide (TPR) repeat protein
MMMKHYLRKALLGAFIVMTVFVFRGVVSAETHQQPYMEVALKHLEKALNVNFGKMIHLDKAKKNLLLAAWDKGGHRTKAIEIVQLAKQAVKRKEIHRANKLIQEAIEHVKAGIGFSDQHTDEPPEVDLETGQPYMEIALKHLEKALNMDKISWKVTNLERAKTNLKLGGWDKGGHRLIALEKIKQALKLLNVSKIPEANMLIREAIEHVNKAIEIGAEKK